MYIAEGITDQALQALQVLAQAEAGRLALIAVIASIFAAIVIGPLVIRYISESKKRADDLQLKLISTNEVLTTVITQIAGAIQQQTESASKRNQQGEEHTTLLKTIANNVAAQSRDFADAISKQASNTITKVGDEVRANRDQLGVITGIVSGSKNIMETHDQTSQQAHEDIQRAVDAIPPNVKQYIETQSAAQLEALQKMMNQLEEQIKAMPAATSEDMKAVLAKLTAIENVLAQLLEQTAKPKTPDPLAIVAPKSESGEGKSA